MDFLSFFLPTAHATIAGASRIITQSGATQASTTSDGSSFLDTLIHWAWVAIDGILLFLLFFLLLKFMRLLYEIYTAHRLVYIKVTLPRADSKLDKERETKKDFKEKVGIMSIFYKAVHKINDLSFVDALKNMIFKHAKASLEVVYDQGQVHFFLVTYPEFGRLISQQITSNYPDAEVRYVEKKDYINIKPAGHTLRTASSAKVHDNIFPIKTYKYFEDDPLSSLTNAFGMLKKEDKAVYQIVVKPLGPSWNKRAKKAAGLLSKGKYKKGVQSGIILQIFQGIVAPLYWIVNRFINNEESGNTAPGASSGDAYRIFNQAEQEAQKMVGESAGQPAFRASIRVLVSSETPESAKNGLYNLLGTTSIFTDEYNNKLEDPRVLEDILSFFFTPIRYIAFKFKLNGLFQTQNVFSVDELSTLYHFPDINYNKSPVIKWLEYKMLAVPANIKAPREPLILSDYKRDNDGNVYTKDGSLLKVDKNKNFVRDEVKNFISITGQVIEIYKDGDLKGKPVDEGKTPITEDKQRYLGGFPLYRDASLMGWNEYRNLKTPIYFDKKDRGRHHYVIGKSG